MQINPFIVGAKGHPAIIKREMPVTDIVEIEFVDTCVKTGDKDIDFVLETKVVESSRINAYEYMMSFKDEVGIENILKKVGLTGDITLLNQRTRPSVAIGDDGKEILQDYSVLPDNPDAAAAALAAGYKAFGALPKELVKGRSFEEFVQTATTDELVAFIKAQYAPTDGEGGKIDE